MGTIEVRAARPDDRAAMFRITRPVWEGNDYVPLVWDRWLAGRDGIVLVATVKGAVVGFQHIQIHHDGDAWFEGIRVAEEARGQGVGEALVDRGLAWARDMDCTAARLAVSSDNEASKRLSEKAGFEVIGCFRTVQSEAAEVPVQTDVRPAQPFDEDAVLELLERAGHVYPATYTEGWTAYRLTRRRLRLLLAMHSVLIAGREAPEAVAIATMPADQPSFRLGLVAGSAVGITELGRRLRVEISRAHLPRVRGTLDASREVLQALEGAGFSGGQVDMLLRERRLS